MSSKSPSRRNSLKKVPSVLSSQASLSSTIPSKRSSISSRRQSHTGMSSQASSISAKSSITSRRSSTVSDQSIESTNESLFGGTGSVASAKSNNSVNSVKSGVIPALYDELRKMDALPDRHGNVSNFESSPKAVEEVAVRRSGRAGVRQYATQTLEKTVDPERLGPLFEDYKAQKFMSLRSYKFRCRHADPSRGTDELVIDAGTKWGDGYISETKARHTYGKRRQERRDFGKVADGLGLRPGTLDVCDIKKVINGPLGDNDQQKNAIWNAFQDPKTFNKQVNSAALTMTGGVTGFKGKAKVSPADTFRETTRDIGEDGKVVLHKVRGDLYKGSSTLAQGKLRRKFGRLPNKLSEIDAGNGLGLQKEKVIIDSNGEIIRMQKEDIHGRLPQSDAAFEQILEGTWRKATPKKMR